MYDRTETRKAWDMFWQLTYANYEAQGFEADLPQTLTWDAAHDAHWLRPDLALSQTCSLPYRTRLQGKVTLLGAFDFALPGCAPGEYNSVLIMRKDDLRTAPDRWGELTLAYNAPDSQSGWAAPYFHAKTLKTQFARGLQTGAHAASAQAVAEGRADIAALDAQTHRLLCRYSPVMEHLQEITRTEPTPSLPLITRPGAHAKPLWAAANQALTQMPAPAKEVLDLHGLIEISPNRYGALPSPPPPETAWAK